MTTYRTGAHWGTAIVRIGLGPEDATGRRPDDELAAVVVNGGHELAERIVRALALLALSEALPPAPRQPHPGEKFWWPTECAKCDKPIAPWSPDHGPASEMTHITDVGGADWDTNRDHEATTACICLTVHRSVGIPDPACTVHQGRRARGPKPPPLGPGCICDGSGRTCPRHGAVL